MSTVSFTEACAAIPADVLLLEIGPHLIMRSPLRQNRPTLQCALLLPFLPHTPSRCYCTAQACPSGQTITGFKSLVTLVQVWCDLLQFIYCRYVGTMKKGSPAVSTVRDAAGALWGKGAALTWKLPEGPAHLPIDGARLSACATARSTASHVMVPKYPCVVARPLAGSNLQTGSTTDSRAPRHTVLDRTGTRGLSQVCTVCAGLPRPIRDALVSWNHGTEFELPSWQHYAAGGGKGLFEKTYDLGALMGPTI